MTLFLGFWPDPVSVFNPSENVGKLSPAMSQDHFQVRIFFKNTAEDQISRSNGRVEGIPDAVVEIEILETVHPGNMMGVDEHRQSFFFQDRINRPEDRIPQFPFPHMGANLYSSKAQLVDSPFHLFSRRLR